MESRVAAFMPMCRWGWEAVIQSRLGFLVVSKYISHVYLVLRRIQRRHVLRFRVIGSFEIQGLPSSGVVLLSKACWDSLFS